MKHFNRLNVPTHWQPYFTKYPQGLTILEALIEWVSQVDDMVESLNELIDLYGDIKSWAINEMAGIISAKLDDMVDDGTLEQIINVELLGSRARIELSEDEPDDPDEQTFWYEVTGEDFSLGDGVYSGNAVVSKDEPEDTDLLWYQLGGF